MIKCVLPAWLFGWVVAIFLPSAAIAYLGLSAPAAMLGVGGDRILATTWKVADDVGPFAKLAFGALMLALFYALARARLTGIALYVAAAACGVSAMAASLAVLPAVHSRGFGVGLTGVRFDPEVAPIYVLGGALAGALFAVLYLRCARRGA